MRIVGLASLVVASLMIAQPAPSQVVCRSNVLGAEVCMGLPAPTARAPSPYTPRGRGLGGVQAPVRAERGPTFTPARRTGALGDTLLSVGDLPPRRQPLPGVAPTQTCVRDALGNLTCR